MSGIVLKRMGSNTKATIDGIKKRIPLIQQALPEGVTFEPYYDQADLIQKAVSTVAYSLLIAFVFIIAVLALFLLNIRATFFSVTVHSCFYRHCPDGNVRDGHVS